MGNWKRTIEMRLLLLLRSMNQSGESASPNCFSCQSLSFSFCVLSLSRKRRKSSELDGSSQPHSCGARWSEKNAHTYIFVWKREEREEHYYGSLVYGSRCTIEKKGQSGTGHRELKSVVFTLIKKCYTNAAKNMKQFNTVNWFYANVQLCHCVFA